MYQCERCDKTFTRFKTPGQCPHCGVWADVRCSGCGYTGPAKVFVDRGDRCPRCGSVVYVGSQPSASSPGARKTTGFVRALVIRTVIAAVISSGLLVRLDDADLSGLPGPIQVYRHWLVREGQPIIERGQFVLRDSITTLRVRLASIPIDRGQLIQQAQQAIRRVEAWLGDSSTPPTITPTPPATPWATPAPILPAESPDTPAPTLTPSSTPRPTQTNTVTPTRTPTMTPSPTRTSTLTRTPTMTPSPTITPTPTPTPTRTPTLPPPLSLALPEALAQGFIRADVRGVGASSGASITISLTRLEPRRLEITLPTGTVFRSQNADTQDMIALRLLGIPRGGGFYQPVSQMVLIDDLPHEYIVEAYCLNFHRDNPGAGDTFAVEADSEPLVTQILSALGGMPANQASIESIQAAVWAVTDNVSRSELQARFPASNADIERAAAILQAAGLEPTIYQLFR